MSPSLTTQDTKTPKQPGFTTEAPVSSSQPATAYPTGNRSIYLSIRLSFNASTLAIADAHGTWAAKVM